MRGAPRLFWGMMLVLVVGATLVAPTRAARLVASVNSIEQEEWRVVTMELDGSELQTVFMNDRFIYDIAVDVSTNQLYWNNRFPEENYRWRLQRATRGVGCFTHFDGSEEWLATLGDLEVLPGSKLYWAQDGNDGESWIARSNLDGSGGELLYSPGVPEVEYELSIDTVNDKVYWGEYRFFNPPYHIARADLDFKNQETVLIRESRILDLFVEPTIGKLYWIEGASASISELWRANPDGDAAELLFPSHPSQLRNLVVDPGTSKIYFTGSGGSEPTLYRADLDGSNREIVATLDVPGGIRDMVLVDGPVGPYSCDVDIPATGRSGTIALIAAILLGGLYVLRRRP